MSIYQNETNDEREARRSKQQMDVVKQITDRFVCRVEFSKGVAKIEPHGIDIMAPFEVLHGGRVVLPSSCVDERFVIDVLAALSGQTWRVKKWNTAHT